GGCRVHGGSRWSFVSRARPVVRASIRRQSRPNALLKSARLYEPAKAGWHGGRDLLRLPGQRSGKAIDIEAGGLLFTTKNTHDQRRQQAQQGPRWSVPDTRKPADRGRKLGEGPAAKQR